jgi:hypothetical protein
MTTRKAIVGRNDHGRPDRATVEQYLPGNVIPRLDSGLIYAREVPEHQESLGTSEPRPFSREFDLLYDEYRHAGHGRSWESWLEGRMRVECGDCGDGMALPDQNRSWVHMDGTPACNSRSEANARRARQGRREVGR